MIPDDVPRLKDLAASLMRAYITDVELAVEYHVHGRTQSELAMRMGITQQAVAKRLRVVHRKLREVGAMPPAWERTPSRAA